jgi:hypothetical protein
MKQLELGLAMKEVRRAKDERLMYKLGNPGKIETGEFKRPDHSDFATMDELREKGFNGQRINGKNKDWELWVNGRVVKTVSEVTYSNAPETIPLAYADFFGMEPDLLEVKGC